MTVIRADLLAAQRSAWESLASPGSWWTAAQRTELAETVRAALEDPDPLPPWVPFSGTGRSPAETTVPPAALDAAYRIARSAGTITESVYRAFADEIGELPFVELCAIVSSVAAVVAFHRNAGTDAPPFDAPGPGAPTQEQPEQVTAAALNWVPVAAPADQSAAVLQAYSAVPVAQRVTWGLGAAQYIPAEEMVHPDWMRRPDGLTRPEAELIATRIAQLRECFY